jgi:inosose dehydratase
VTARLAVNPIAYWLVGGTPDRTTRTLGPAFTELAEIGYTAVKADVPDDMAAGDYLPWLASFGLEPALSLYSGAFADRATHAAQAEAARIFAARQASFGQRFGMISTIEPPGSPRREHPAVGQGFDPDRLDVVIEGIALCCAAMRAEGVTAALHPHVGGWVETEHEVRAVLDGVGPDLLAFGPDTGHMSWAGMDVPAVLRDYADRIVGVHLKDTFAAGIARAEDADLDYQTATEPGRIWAEPGLGDVDLAACLAAFPAGFAGDYMIEVDVPSLPLRECHQVAFDWARGALP